MKHFIDIDYYRSLFKDSSARHIQLFLFSVFAFFLPFKMIFGNVVVVLILITFFVQLSKEGMNFQIHPLLYVFLGVYAASVLGMAFTNNLKHGLFLLEVRLSLLIFPLIVYMPKPFVEERDIEQILNTFMLGLACSFWYSFVETFQLLLGVSDLSWDLFIYHFADFLPLTHIYFGLYSSLAISFLVYISLSRKSFKKVYYLYLGTFGLFMALFVPKTALIALVLSTIFLILKFRHSIRTVQLYAIGLLFVLGIGSMFAFPKSRARLRQFTFGYSQANMVNDKGNYSALRTVPFYCSVDLISTNWLLGLGTGDVQDTMDKWYQEHGFLDIVTYNSHNQYFDWLLAFGIFGFVICMSPFLHVFILSLKKNHVVYLSFLLVLLLAFCTENILNNNKGVMFYSFFNSLFAVQLVRKV